MSSPIVAIGSNQLWGFSPAVDLQLHAVRPTAPSAAPAAAANPQSAAAAASPTASNTGKSGSSSALARLLAKSSISASSAPVAVPDAGSLGSLSLLLVECGDVVSAFKTAVRSHTHTLPDGQPVPLQLFLLDTDANSTARHLLLLAIAFDTQLSLRGENATAAAPVCRLIASWLSSVASLTATLSISFLWQVARSCFWKCMAMRSFKKRRSCTSIAK
jgi:hypothetical protein